MPPSSPTTVRPRSLLDKLSCLSALATSKMSALTPRLELAGNSRLNKSEVKLNSNQIMNLKPATRIHRKSREADLERLLSRNTLLRQNLKIVKSKLVLTFRAPNRILPRNREADLEKLLSRKTLLRQNLMIV